jgi:hypothetical protein
MAYTNVEDATLTIAAAAVHGSQILTWTLSGSSQNVERIMTWANYPEADVVSSSNIYTCTFNYKLDGTSVPVDLNNTLQAVIITTKDYSYTFSALITGMEVVHTVDNGANEGSVTMEISGAPVIAAV